MTDDRVEKIFEDDEMGWIQIKTQWTEKELLRQKGLFSLKSVIKVLEINSSGLRSKLKAIEMSGGNTWEIAGIRKIWNQWLVRMHVFAPYFHNNLFPSVKKVPRNIDGNGLLRLKGVYSLTDVCRHLPFSAHQIRYQAKSTPNSKKMLGVWKDPELNKYVVDMAVFAPWVGNLWKRDFGRR